MEIASIANNAKPARIILGTLNRGIMAAMVRLTLAIPRYCPSIGFSDEGYAFITEHKIHHRFEPFPYEVLKVPKEAYMRTSHKIIADFVSISGVLGVSRKARDLINGLEPGVHQFIPVNIIRMRGNKPIFRLDGHVLDEPYYLFNCMVWLDAVVLDRSEVLTYEIGDGTVSVRLNLENPGAKVILNKRIVDDHHVWQGNRHLFGRLFFSNHLMNLVEENNLKYLEVQYHDEE